VKRAGGGEDGGGGNLDVEMGFLSARTEFGGARPRCDDLNYAHGDLSIVP